MEESEGKRRRRSRSRRRKERMDEELEEGSQGEKRKQEFEGVIKSATVSLYDKNAIATR